jgi:hypothetical protein
MSMMVAILLTTFLQEDKIGKEKAPAIVKKSSGEMGKKKGFHFTSAGTISGPRSQSTSFEGVQKKDFAAARGSAEVYAKGAAYLVHSDGKFISPDKLSGAEALPAASFRNPSLFLHEISYLSATASWGNDAEVDGYACKTADLVADEKVLKQQIKEFAELLGSQFRQLGDVSSLIDPKKTTSHYKVYIGISDLLIYKIEWILKPVVKANSGIPTTSVPNLDNLEATTGVTLSKFDEDLEIEIPKEIKARFSVK